jgi:hypothetical protein
MTGTTDVLDLVERWAAAEQGNDAEALDGLLTDDFVGVGPLGFVLGRDQETSFRGGDNSGRFRLTLVAVQPADRWLLANAHIGMLQPAGPPAS